MSNTKRNPDGVVKGSPIPLRLMPQELKEAHAVADQFQISRSKLGRDAFIAGLPIVIKRLSSAAANLPPSKPAADLTGGEASASPSGLSSLAE